MLVLERHEDQRITLEVPPSDKVTFIDVMLVEVRGWKKAATIGIDAPRSVQITRDDAVVKGPKTSATEVHP